jgi:hypothetical protein
VLKFLRKSRKNFYIVLFLILTTWFILYDFLTKKEIELLFNILQGVVFVAVYVFLDWAFGRKDKRKKK